MVLRWFDALQECRDVPRDSPSGQAVIAVAGVLVSHADPDGRNCYPATRTIAARARASRRTVRVVLAWLVDNGWLTVARKVQRRSTVYRLTIPVGADEHPPDESSWVPTSTHHGTSVGAVVGAVVGADEHPDLLPPNEEEEEEEERLFSTASSLSLDPESKGAVEGMVVEIARHAGVSVDPERAGLGAALIEARGRTGWSNDALAVYCVETLRRVGRKVIEPSALLATDLGRVSASTRASPRMLYAEQLTKLCDLSGELERTGRLDAGEQDPITHFEELLGEARLIGPYDGFPSPCEVTDAQLEQVHGLAVDAFYKATLRKERPQ